MHICLFLCTSTFIPLRALFFPSEISLERIEIFELLQWILESVPGSSTNKVANRLTSY